MHHVAETGSTNTDLIDALARATMGDGEVADRTVLVADHQTVGRGRLDRRWDAPAGANLLVSVAFVEVPATPVSLTQRIGLAAVDAARRARPDATVMLKWPNDVLLDDRKLAGVLAQREPSTGAVVVGIGLNVGWAPEGAARLGDRTTPAAVLGDLLVAFDALGPDVAERYRRDLTTLGRDVRVELPSGDVLEGRAVDVDADGRLVVEDRPGSLRVVDVGDVVHARHAG